MDGCRWWHKKAKVCRCTKLGKSVIVQNHGFFLDLPVATISLSILRISFVCFPGRLTRALHVSSFRVGFLLLASLSARRELGMIPWLSLHQEDFLYYQKWKDSSHLYLCECEVFSLRGKTQGDWNLELLPGCCFAIALCILDKKAKGQKEKSTRKQR